MEHNEHEFLFNIQSNPLKTKNDTQVLFRELINPLVNSFCKNTSHLFLNNTSALYNDQIAGLEAFSRPLWGLGPFWAGGGQKDITWKLYIEGIQNGVDPTHEEFWGYPGDYDQRTVETASFGLTLALHGEELFEELTDESKENLVDWLQSVNDAKTPDNNWNLFKVMVNVGLSKLGVEGNESKNEEAFERLESYYLGNGWYSDGLTEQKDYYVSFAIHFYCLIYSEMMKNEDPKKAKLFKDRAAIFAKDFIYWFSADGSSFPFGRSMTYRFAQTSFWTAMAFAGVEAIPWGQVKGIVLRHLRWWMQQPIFTKDGVLSIGYGYPNLIMSEDYNAPGSPYWAFKSFLILALSEKHPFWIEEEQYMPQLFEVKVEKEPQMIICRDKYNKHVYALTSGQYAGFEPPHTAEKYSKFAYSNQFGFSISRENYGLNHGAYDSMLALSEKDNYWRARRTCENVDVQGEFIYALWKPWHDVTIETWLIPINLWHVRLHRVQSKRSLDTAEGGFAVPIKDLEQTNRIQYKNYVKTLEGLSGIIDLQDKRDFEIIQTSPNTNMLSPNVTGLPTLSQSIDPGSHWLASAVLAHKDESIFMAYWNTPPEMIVDEESFRIVCGDTERLVNK